MRNEIKIKSFKEEKTRSDIEMPNNDRSVSVAAIERDFSAAPLIVKSEIGCIYFVRVYGYAFIFSRQSVALHSMYD